MTQGSAMSLEQIQGRLNQREIPWLATESGQNDAAVTFTPNDRSGVSVVWDRGHPAARSLDDIIEFLASYR